MCALYKETNIRIGFLSINTFISKNRSLKSEDDANKKSVTLRLFYYGHNLFYVLWSISLLKEYLD